MKNLREFAVNYLDIINTTFAGLNLTRITEFDDFFNRQILEAVNSLDCSIFNKNIKKNRLILDIGFGGGFPILPLAKKMAEFKFVGFEARKKKVLAVDEIAKILGLNNCSFFHERVENILIDLSCVVVFKAVGRVDEMLSKINNSKEITVFFYKGPDFINEEKLISLPENWIKISHEEIKVSGLNERYLIGYKNVPRGTFLKKKAVVKLSSLL